MQKMENWAHRLYPKVQFEEFIDRVERLGKKKEVQVGTGWRSDAPPLSFLHSAFCKYELVVFCRPVWKGYDWTCRSHMKITQVRNQKAFMPQLGVNIKVGCRGAQVFHTCCISKSSEEAPIWILFSCITKYDWTNRLPTARIQLWQEQEAAAAL